MKPWGGGGVAEKEVVRLDVSMDNPHGVDQFDQTKQLGSQVDGNWLNDAPGELRWLQAVK